MVRTSFPYLISFFLLLAACGPQQANQGQLVFYADATPGLHLNRSKCHQGHLGQDPLVDEVQSLVSSLRNFISSAAINFSGIASSGERVRFSSPDEPMLMSRDLFGEELEAIRVKLYEIFGPSLYQLVLSDGPYPRVLNINLEDIEKVLEQLQDLTIKVNRWRYFECTKNDRLEHKNYDTRVFLRARQNDVRPNKADALELCHSFYSESRCQSEWVVFERLGRTEEFFYAYRERFAQERFMPLFSLRSTAPKLSCQRLPEDNGFELTLKILDDEGLRAVFPQYLEAQLTEVANYWSRPHFKFKLELVQEADDQTVQIRSEESFISHVNSLQPFVIFIQENLHPSARVRILAHELGHVLGFPDCYIEFYDQRKGMLIYYEHEREQGNLMCSIDRGEIIPDDYLGQLKEHSCSK